MTGSDQPRATNGSSQTSAIYQRVALVGCGHRFAASVAPTLRQANVAVALAADPDPRALDLVTAIAPYAEDLIMTGSLTQQRLLDAQVDAIIISSPSGLHFEHCITALACGLPTFVEKPLACSAPDARRLQAASHGRLVASEQRMHREDLRYARSIIRSGVLGEISELRYYDSITPAPHFARTWRNNPRLAGGGILLDLGYHTVSSVQWLLDLGSEDIVVTKARLETSALQVEDAAQIACTAAGVKVSLDIRLVELAPRELVFVKGALGELRLYRPRKRPPVAEISVEVRGREPARHQLPLDYRTDSRVLLDFLCGRTEAHKLERHIDALEFLEQAYDCSSLQEEVRQDAVEGLG
ncbi:MAG: Gfo/Idh/MocA family protein [Streptosporangiaceae bacterium]